MKKSKMARLAGITAAAVLAFSSLTVCAAGDSVYTTQKGDNLSKIAQKMYGDRARWRDIFDANRDTIKDPNKIWANQQLVIPGGIVTVTTQPLPVPQNMPSQWPEQSAEWQAAAAAGQSYVQQNGLQFYQGTSFTTQGYRYNDYNLDLFEFIPQDVKINGITIRDAAQEGYQVVTIASSRSGYVMSEFEGPGMDCISFPNIQICDIYTGKILPSAATSGDAELVNTANLSWGGISYSLDYIQAISWDWGDWSDLDESWKSYSLGTAIGTNTVTIPKGYDGLAILVTPSTEGPDADKEYNTFDNDNEKYILDKWKDGSYLMRVSDLYNILNGK